MLILLSNITLFLKHKIIVCDRNNPLEEHSKFYFYMSCLLYNFASLICVQTYQIKSFYPKYLQNKIKVIENPLDSEALNAQIDIVPTREKRIISIGRLEPQKDFITLINAFSNILHTYPDWNLDIYGVGYMHEIINELINKKNLSQFVHLKGHTTKPFYELKKSSIFVLSSNYEGFPNVLCEAMYAEDICIASDCISGPKELIHHGENGWLFKIGDENELTKLLEKAILLHNSKEGKDLRISAHQTVKRLEINNIFVDWEKAVKEIID